MPRRADDLDRVADRRDAGLVALDARQVALRGPAAVAVHDDGDVDGSLAESTCFARLSSGEPGDRRQKFSSDMRVTW